MATVTVPDWIYPGADVVAYRDTPGAIDTNYRETTVAKLAGQSFTVDGLVERIKLDGLTSKRLGGSWDSYQYRVIEVGSEQHLRMQAARRIARAEAAAHAAVDDWLRGRRDRVKLDTAVAALAALRDELPRA